MKLSDLRKRAELTEDHTKFCYYRTKPTKVGGKVRGRLMRELRSQGFSGGPPLSPGITSFDRGSVPSDCVTESVYFYSQDGTVTYDRTMVKSARYKLKRCER